MTIYERIREWALMPILQQLNELKEILTTMATTQAQYDAILTQLSQTVTAEDSTISTALSAIETLLAKVAAGSTADLTSEATAAQAMIADIKAQTDSLAAEVAKTTATGS